MSQTNSRLQGGGLILPQGSSPGGINVGEQALILDSDGTAKLQDAAGNKSSVGGGVGWDAQQWTRIQTLLGSQVDNYMWSDMLNPNEYDVTTGVGPFAQLAGSTGGVLRNGAASGTLYLAGQKSAAGSVVPLPNLKTSAWAVAARTRFAIAPSGAGVETDIAGMVGSTHQVSVQIETNTSTTVLQIKQVAAGTTRTSLSALGTIGSGLAVGTWFDVLLVNDVSNARLIAQINGVTAATETVLTNLSTQAGRPFFDSNQGSAIDFDAVLLAFKREP